MKLDENMIKAVQSVLSGELSQNKASKEFGVARSTLNVLYNKVKAGEVVLPDNKKGTVGSEETESETVPTSDITEGQATVEAPAVISCNHDCKACKEASEDEYMERDSTLINEALDKQDIAEKKSESLQNQLSSLGEEKTQLENEISSFKVKIEDLEKRLAEVPSCSACTALATAENEKQRLEIITAEIPDLKSKLQDAEASAGAVPALKEKIESMESTITSISNEKTTLETEAKSKDEMIEKIQGDLTAKGEELRQAVVDKDSFKKQVAGLSEEIKRMELERARLLDEGKRKQDEDRAEYTKALDAIQYGKQQIRNLEKRVTDAEEEKQNIEDNARKEKDQFESKNTKAFITKALLWTVILFQTPITIILMLKFKGIM